MKRLLPALAILLFTACSSYAGVPVGGSADSHQSPAKPAHSETNLFIGDQTGIREYTRHGRFVQAISFTSRGTSTVSLAFDPSGNLFAISGYFAISVFAPGSRALVRTISDGVFEPLAIAVDSSGNLYVANGHNGYKGNITVYSPGSGTPSSTITESIYDPESLAFDSKGNLYVGAGSYADYITVYSPSGALLRTIKDGVQDPTSIALDSHDDLFVANTALGAGRSVTVYSPGKNKLIQTVTDGVRSPQSLALDSTGQLYVADNSSGTVTVYAAKTRTLLRTISKQIRYPWVVAIDSADKLYVANLLPKVKIDVFRPGQSKPEHVIHGDGWTALALAFGPP